MENKNILELLQNKYPSDQYALMAEVSNAAGFARSNSADYIVVGLWPSRGLHITGIELKSSRYDWIRERKNPAKAESIFMYCDFFWLLTTEEYTAKIEEIPSTWGWMCVKGSKIVVKKDAPKQTPAETDRDFICAMLKRATDKSKFVHLDSIKDKIAASYELGKVGQKIENERLQSRIDALQMTINDFERAAGVKIKSYMETPTQVGAAVKFALSGGIKNIQSELKILQGKAEKILTNINNVLDPEHGKSE